MQMKEYTPSQVAHKMKNDPLVLLDVRTHEEWNRSHIEGALHIPVKDLMENIQELERYKAQEIICYCHSGSRSWAAASILQRYGYNAVNMKGGIVEWNRKELQ